MDESLCNEMDERMSIRDTSRKLKKYGSTSKHIIRNDCLIKHFVSKTDTLPGIALKYGVTTEQIRRTNRLWASDSLFLREYLLIPIAKDLATTSSENHDTSIQNSMKLDGCQVPNSSTVPSRMNDDSSIDNFLAKMDSSIANVKKDVKKTQENSSFASVYDNDLSLQRRVGSRLRHSHPHTSPLNRTSQSFAGSVKSSSEDDVHDLPSAVVMTHGKKLRTSLQKLQQQQDEMFQL